MEFRVAINSQPEAILRSVQTARSELESIETGLFSSGSVAVTGIGASFAAATVTAEHLLREGRHSVAVRPTDLMQAEGMFDSLIALSHRGRSVEICEAVAFQRDVPGLAICKDRQSPLAEASKAHLLLDSGPDSTPSSSGFVGTLAAVGVFADSLFTSEVTNWQQVADFLADSLDRNSARLDRAVEMFGSPRSIDCVGAGAALGTADGAALLIREAARIPASHFETRQYLHGPMEALDGHSAAVIFGDDREVEIAYELQDVGCPVLLVTANPDAADTEFLTVVRRSTQRGGIAQAILDIVPAQLLAAGLSDALGLTDTKFRYPQNDTKIK